MFALSLWLFFLQPAPGVTTTLMTGTDPSILYHIRGNAGNVLFSANRKDQTDRGIITTQYQESEGFVAFDRLTQTVKAEFKRDFSLNRLSKTIRAKAPRMDVKAPFGSTVAFDLKLSDLGIGQFNFSDLNVRSFVLDANFGEVYLDFPTINQRIIRDEVSVHLTAGYLEINQLANLKAQNWIVNGGVGELKLDIGDKLHGLTNIKLDLDIGTLSLSIPKGTRVEVHGTNRNLEPYGFIKQEEDWIVSSYHEASPILSIYLLGPLGELQIDWD